MHASQLTADHAKIALNRPQDIIIVPSPVLVSAISRASLANSGETSVALVYAVCFVVRNLRP